LLHFNSCLQGELGLAGAPQFSSWACSRRASLEMSDSVVFYY